MPHHIFISLVLLALGIRSEHFSLPGQLINHTIPNFLPFIKPHEVDIIDIVFYFTLDQRLVYFPPTDGVSVRDDLIDAYLTLTKFFAF